MKEELLQAIAELGNQLEADGDQLRPLTLDERLVIGGLIETLEGLLGPDDEDDEEQYG